MRPRFAFTFIGQTDAPESANILEGTMIYAKTASAMFPIAALQEVAESRNEELVGSCYHIRIAPDLNRLRDDASDQRYRELRQQRCHALAFRC